MVLSAMAFFELAIMLNVANSNNRPNWSIIFFIASICAGAVTVFIVTEVDKKIIYVKNTVYVDRIIIKEKEGETAIFSPTKKKDGMSYCGIINGSTDFFKKSIEEFEASRGNNHLVEKYEISVTPKETRVFNIRYTKEEIK